MQIIITVEELNTLLVRALLRGFHAPVEPHDRGEWTSDTATEILGDFVFRELNAPTPSS